MAHIDQEVNHETTTNGTEGLFSVDYPVMEKAMKTTIKVLRVEPLSEVDKVEKVEREATYSPDEVTVVESTDKLLYTKKLVYEGGKLVNKVSAPHAVWHKATNRSVSNYDELNALLLELSGNKTACVIRGQVFDCHQGQKVQRTNQGGWKKPKHSNVKKAQTAYFTGVPRRWLCVDIDGDDSKGLDCFVYAPVPSGTPAEVANFMAHWLVNTWLPEPFRGCRAVVQFSSSFWASGVSSKVKAHIWFLLDEPIGAKEVQDVMWQAYSREIAGDGKPYVMGDEEGQRRLDGCTARIAHPNFTASPLVIEDGVVVPDKHIDYRVIEVNKDGGRVCTATLLSDLDAAKESNTTLQQASAGGIVEPKAKTVHKSDPTAQGDILTWDAKTHADYKLAQEALSFLGASYYDFYKPWLEVGMCIHYRFAGQEGLDLWTKWSKQSSHYTESEVEDECETKWGTFTTNVENPRTLGKLFGMASDNGWSGLKKKAVAVAAEDCEQEVEQSFFESDVVEIPGVGVASDATSYDIDLERDDKANAQRLYNAFGDRLRYISDADRWAVFMGGRWKALDKSKKGLPTGILTTMIGYVVDRIDNEGILRARRVEKAVEAAALRDGVDAPKAKEKAKKAAAREIAAYQTWRATSHQPAPRHTAMLYHLMGMPGISTRSSDWDSDPLVIGTPKGIVDLRTKTVRPYTPNDLMLRCAKANFVPEQGPVIEADISKLVEDLMGQASDLTLTDEAKARAEYLWKTLAYCLTGETHREKFFMWHGSLGGNGKSTMSSVLLAILGDADDSGYGVTLNAATVLQGKEQAGGARTDLDKLEGARFAVVNDIEESPRTSLNTGFIKDATGVRGLARITCRGLYAAERTFAPQFKLLLICNTPPQFSADGGMTRRLEAISFGRSWHTGDPSNNPTGKPIADPYLLEKLTKRIDHIFTYLVHLAADLIANGFKMSVPASVMGFTTETSDDMNPLRAFIAECCQAGDERVQASRLLSAYKAWRRVNSGSRDYSPVSFASEMERLGYSKVDHRGSKLYLGLRIVEGRIPGDNFSAY